MYIRTLRSSDAHECEVRCVEKISGEHATSVLGAELMTSDGYIATASAA